MIAPVGANRGFVKGVRMKVHVIVFALMILVVGASAAQVEKVSVEDFTTLDTDDRVEAWSLPAARTSPSGMFRASLLLIPGDAPSVRIRTNLDLTGDYLPVHYWFDAGDMQFFDWPFIASAHSLLAYRDFTEGILSHDRVTICVSTLRNGAFIAEFDLGPLQAVTDQ